MDELVSASTQGRFDEAPRVSFIVIALNAERTIRDCIASIASQQVPKEILLVDNGSTDRTVSEVAGLPVTVLHEPRRRRGTARNRGLAAARGRDVAFVDADVALPPDWAAKALRILSQHPGVAAVGGPGRTPHGSWVSEAVDALQYGHALQDKSAYVVSLATMDVLYRGECVRGLRFADFWAAEDPEFNFRLVARGFRLLWSRDLCVAHHHSQSLAELVKKAYAYGKWFPAPYWRHPRRVDAGVLFRLAFLPAALVMGVLACPGLVPPWCPPAWLFAPFLMYTVSAVRLKPRPTGTDGVRFVLVHGCRQMAQMTGIWAGILGGTWREFGQFGGEGR